MGMRHYRDLIAWQKAMDLVVRVYEATKEFPPEERFGLTTQLRRAAVSVASNIADGQGRHATRKIFSATCQSRTVHFRRLKLS